MNDRPAFPIELKNVRGGEDEFPVRLCVDGDSGRLVIRAFNEGGFACVDIDFLDLARWFQEHDAAAIARAFDADHR